MASGKPRSTRKLRSWIIEQLESGQFPGVCWDDADKTMFRIPWKHAGKQDFREDQDAALFKAWALYKGYTNEGNAAVWKTRLRCALNKSSEFEEVPERGRMDVAEPYKVYRILPPGTLPDSGCGGRGILGCRGSSSSSGSGGGGGDSSGGTSGRDSSSISGDSSSGGGSPEPEEGACLQEEASIQEDPVFMEHQLPLNSVLAWIPALDLSFPVINTGTLDPTEPHAPWREGLFSAFRLLLHLVKLDFSVPRLLAAAHLHLQWPCGGEMLQVTFPKPDPLEPIQHLLSQLERGILVASNSRGLFVQRLCPIPISWNAPKAPPGPGPHLLPSNKCVELFSTNYFYRDLAQYCQGQGPPPKFQATLNFWEEKPDSNHTQENLITVRMEQAFARHLLETVPEEQRAALFLVQNPELPSAALQPPGTRLPRDQGLARPHCGCRVMEQKEVPDGFRDEACGKETPAGYAGLCQAHYKEYLVSLINAHSLDPATLYEVEELETATTRYLHVHPEPMDGEDLPAYQARLLQKLTEEVPLGQSIARRRK
ncbi:interferon regulatory factor 9-like [Peromyscus californicus insignis]|uniref:interferon regulatory factor 9-like n=1 Tax=Peromyscus californicus insignis TaxID=564181 RepID=UPI0022A698AB|nr:interferon regulatory factor 9-like [Peromyscus californicus insignis]